MIDTTLIGRLTVLANKEKKLKRPQQIALLEGNMPKASQKCGFCHRVTANNHNENKDENEILQPTA